MTIPLIGDELDVVVEIVDTWVDDEYSDDVNCVEVVENSVDVEKIDDVLVSSSILSQ